MFRMNKKNVLVFPCGSEIGLELYRSLRYAKEVELFGASSVDDHGRFVYDRYFSGFPFAHEDTFIDTINSYVTKYSIDHIFPGHDNVVTRLSQAKAQDRLVCNVLTSPHQTCRTCRSKHLTYDRFSGVLRIPKVYQTLEEVDVFPVFLKPDIGQGSKGTHLAKTRDEVVHHLKSDPSLLILEYLPGTEYTIDCFTDKYGELKFVGARERVRTQNGISVHTRPVDGKEFIETALTINSNLRFQGMWFFQLKRSAIGDLALLEIAPRLAGTMGMYRNLGVNFPLLALYDAEGYDVEALVNNYEIEMDRALSSKFRLSLVYRHVYIDLDDCILVNGQVNLLAITFLFQCINREVEVHLLTRHSGDLDQTLDRYRLAKLFDSVHLLSDDQRKSSFVEYSDSIFIDDSYRERKEVAEQRGIAVFAPDAIESLVC